MFVSYPFSFKVSPLAGSYLLPTAHFDCVLKLFVLLCCRRRLSGLLTTRCPRSLTRSGLLTTRCPRSLTRSTRLRARC